MTATHDSRSFFVEKPGGRLEAILWKPSSIKRPPLAAVVGHPHPLFGGTMHNKVVYQTAKTLDALGIPVNDSDFSFLWRCNKAKLFVHGSNDEYGAIAKVKTLVASLPGDNHLVVVEGADHFFAA